VVGIRPIRPLCPAAGAWRSSAETKSFSGQIFQCYNGLRFSLLTFHFDLIYEDPVNTLSAKTDSAFEQPPYLRWCAQLFRALHLDGI
jgi:hypothetical protein